MGLRGKCNKNYIFLEKNMIIILIVFSLEHCNCNKQSVVNLPSHLPLSTRTSTSLSCWIAVKHNYTEIRSFQIAMLSVCHCVYVQITACVFMCLTHRVHSACGGGSPLPGSPQSRHEAWSPPKQTNQPWMFGGSSHLYTLAFQSGQSPASVKALQRLG